MALKLVQTDDAPPPDDPDRKPSNGRNVVRLATGDSGASTRVEQVRDLAAAWSDRLRAYARSVVHSPHTAADVMQDVLMRLCDPNCPSPPLDDLNSPPLRAWLFTAVRNRGIDHLRKEGRVHEMGDGFDPKSARPTPLEQVEEQDAASAALRALDGLPALQRDALRLRFSANMSYKQIAESMGKTVSHVGVLIHEGLKALRDQLDKPLNLSNATGSSASSGPSLATEA